jgi:putative sterol carrier protein
MPETVESFFQALESSIEPAKTAGIDHTYIFDIAGAGRWRVEVRDGSVDASEGGGEADAVISTSSETFSKIANGEQSPATAYMTGALEVSGDIAAAMKLQEPFGR